MANFNALLDSTCKTRISQISDRCQIQGGNPQFLILNSEMNLKIFVILGGFIPKTFDPELRSEFKIFF